MARVWVKGYTKSDGTKVEGHYREMGASVRAITNGEYSPGNKTFFYGRGTHRRIGKKYRAKTHEIIKQTPQVGLRPPSARIDALKALQKSRYSRRFSAVGRAVSKFW